MPKTTFHNLDPSKKRKLIEAFLREFSLKNYDDASLTAVVKSLEIAKGSIYQYFDDKYDLFIYLITECGKVKEKYTGNVKREDFSNFWDYYRAVYKAGIRFDLQHPLESNFLHSLATTIKTSSLQETEKMYLGQVMTYMESWVKHEVELGLFRNDLPVKAMAFFLYSVSVKIGEYMKFTFDIDIQSRIAQGLPVYADANGTKLMQAVEDNISLLQPALDKSTL